MKDSDGLLQPKKYYLGFAVLLLAFGVWFRFFAVPDPGFWKGIVISLLVSLSIYNFRFYLLWKHSKEGFPFQFGTTVLSFFIHLAVLVLFIWRGEREGFVIGFFIAHFANLLILVFAR
ncbi:MULTISPECIES: hypothetical protein [unclassified Leptospira]|uniref:hypothetical protein n=1 Tax=unclassified Leptospira TaxID=2633828 RepID=UPI0002C00FE5|nr:MULTISPECIES: hypothetical protein [unclassified Leptospira]EMJ97132.1 hypothetical protein LEP1GSC192_3483 [Leptospira sp. B5-022]MCR1793203.1 hypothetical protein [Leptospira sp. id769339]